MRTLLVLLLVTACLAQEAQPRQLDPSKPADAVQIVHLLTEKITLPRDQAVALTQAIQTLAALAATDGAPAPAPATPATPDPKATKP